ncbi:hypothetical protein QR680_008054 [Steinernema hermaphroditum]|uniref:Secreted protein n=1 Tax=Steinernema hermaphroditum TaxID=289476 RepID=A0AA39IF60_9BILA|nr:hypothetical protein QR680_008054 [Steinernema hermaphroditum]
MTVMALCLLIHVALCTSTFLLVVGCASKGPTTSASGQKTLTTRSPQCDSIKENLSKEECQWDNAAGTSTVSDQQESTDLRTLSCFKDSKLSLKSDQGTPLVSKAVPVAGDKVVSRDDGLCVDKDGRAVSQMVDASA